MPARHTLISTPRPLDAPPRYEWRTGLLTTLLNGTIGDSHDVQWQPADAKFGDVAGVWRPTDGGCELYDATTGAVLERYDLHGVLYDINHAQASARRARFAIDRAAAAARAGENESSPPRHSARDRPRCSRPLRALAASLVPPRSRLPAERRERPRPPR